MSLDTHTIGSITLSAFRVPRGWRAQIDATGQILPKTYPPLPSMWTKLTMVAKTRGAKWAKECLTFQA